jgi:hypothetical protein
VLGEKHDARALIEITLLVGHYEMLAGLLNSVGLRLEAHSESVLRAFLDRLSAGPR